MQPLLTHGTRTHRRTPNRHYLAYSTDQTTDQRRCPCLRWTPPKGAAPPENEIENENGATASSPTLSHTHKHQNETTKKALQTDLPSPSSSNPALLLACYRASRRRHILDPTVRPPSDCRRRYRPLSYPPNLAAAMQSVTRRRGHFRRATPPTLSPPACSLTATHPRMHARRVPIVHSRRESPAPLRAPPSCRWDCWRRGGPRPGAGPACSPRCS